MAKENAIEIEDHTKESEATAEIIMMEATVVNESVREEEIQTPAEVQKIIIDVTAESDNGIPVASKRGNEIPVASNEPEQKSDSDETEPYYQCESEVDTRPPTHESIRVQRDLKVVNRK